MRRWDETKHAHYDFLQFQIMKEIENKKLKHESYIAQNQNNEQSSSAWFCEINALTLNFVNIKIVYVVWEL